MMPDNIKDYVKVYDNFFEDKFCSSLVNELKKVKWEEHSFYHYASDQNISYEKF